MGLFSLKMFIPKLIGKLSGCSSKAIGNFPPFLFLFLVESSFLPFREKSESFPERFPLHWKDFCKGLGISCQKPQEAPFSYDFDHCSYVIYCAHIYVILISDYYTIQLLFFKKNFPKREPPTRFNFIALFQ